MINSLLSTHRRKYPISTLTHAKNVHSSNISVPEIPSNITSSEETYITSIEKLYAVINILETMIFCPRAQLQMSKI